MDPSRAHDNDPLAGDDWLDATAPDADADADADDAFAGGIPDDPRFGSGIPGGVRIDEGEFIRMAGFAAPDEPAEHGRPAPEAPQVRGAEPSAADPEGASAGPGAAAAHDSTFDVPRDEGAGDRESLNAILDDLAGAAQRPAPRASALGGAFDGGPDLATELHRLREELHGVSARMESSAPGGDDTSALALELRAVRGEMLRAVQQLEAASAEPAGLIHELRALKSELLEALSHGGALPRDEQETYRQEPSVAEASDQAIIESLKTQVASLAAARDADARTDSQSDAPDPFMAQIIERLDALVQGGGPPASPPAGPPEPAPAPEAPRDPEADAREKDEAERLIAELTAARAREPMPDPVRDGEGEGAGFTLDSEDEDDDGADEASGSNPEDAIYRRDSPPHLRRSSRKTRRRRRIFFAGAGLVAASLIAVAGYLVNWTAVLPSLSTPSSKYAAAESRQSKGRFQEAAARYASFYQQFPGHPQAAEALFQAAFALQQAEGAHTDEAYLESLALFETFQNQFPEHELAARAEIFHAIVLARVGRQQEAIQTLGDPALRLAEPHLALPMLRALGAAYRDLGDYGKAASAYRSAAAMSENYTPDADYLAIHDLHVEQADGAPSETARNEHLDEAADALERALRVPGLSRDDRRAIEDRLEDVAQRRLGVYEAPRPTAEDAEPALGLDAAADSMEALLPTAPGAFDAEGLAGAAPAPDANAEAAGEPDDDVSPEADPGDGGEPDAPVEAEAGLPRQELKAQNAPAAAGDAGFPALDGADESDAAPAERDEESDDATP